MCAGVVGARKVIFCSLFWEWERRERGSNLLPLVSFSSFSVFPNPNRPCQYERSPKARHEADSFQPVEWSELLIPGQAGWLGSAAAGLIIALTFLILKKWTKIKEAWRWRSTYWQTKDKKSVEPNVLSFVFVRKSKKKMPGSREEHGFEGEVRAICRFWVLDGNGLLGH